ncbi:MAG: hypothetical protein ACO319_01165 [Candidatus Nanopelagicaceae bacterium]
MSLHKPKETNQEQSGAGLHLEISPKPTDLERAVIEAAVHRHLQSSEKESTKLKSRYGATRLREFER